MGMVEGEGRARKEWCVVVATVMVSDRCCAGAVLHSATPRDLRILGPEHWQWS